MYHTLCLELNLDNKQLTNANIAILISQVKLDCSLRFISLIDGVCVINHNLIESSFRDAREVCRRH